MTPRTLHIGASFAIVLVAYWAYALLAVPFIEPPPPRQIIIDGGDRKDKTLPFAEGNDLSVLFPPGSWELKDAKIINSNGKALLLWQSYKNHSDGWVDLMPLTIIFMSDEDEIDPKERMRHAVVLEVPEGANLRFDRPLDLNKGGPGRLIEGKLHGPVRIRRQGKRPDHQDDLLVLTRDVDLSEQRITTMADVDFHWGLHSGRGRQMEIKLLPRLGPHVANQEGPNVGGIEQFQLEHVERLHLDMGSSSAATAKSGSPQASGASALGALSSHSGPVDITCRGPFRFHLVEQVATFRDQVDVLRVQPNGPSDHLSCELLSIFFKRPAPRPGGAPAKQSAPGFDLKPARIEAQGTPAMMNAPMDHMQARAERMQYDLIDGHIYLEDAQEVVLKKEANEIHTQSLRYAPEPQGHPGQFQLLAGGPGWLRGEMASRPGQPLEARWHEKLEVRPQEKNQVISLSGGASLKFQAMGQLDARDIHFWLHQSPPDALGHSSLKPDRLLAEGSVVGNSPKFSSKVERLEVWFTSTAPAAVTNAASPSPSAGPSTAAGIAAANPATPYVPSTAASPLAPLGAQAPPTAGGQQAHLEISGRLLQARVLLRDQEHGDLTEVTVVENVKLQETQTAQPNERPLLVTGQWLHATDANSPQAKVTVTGEPAHMEGRGMSLTGPNIQIDRGADTLTMEGPGRMEKFLDRDLENRPLGQADMVRIDWQKRMTFDGRKAHFQDGVSVTSTSKQLQTGWLDVSFQQPISFSDPRPQQPPLVEKMICGDGVFVESRSFEAGQQISNDHMQMKNFDLDNITGEFHADGPGWVNSVRRGGGQGFSMPGSPLTGSAGATARPVALGGPPTAQPDPNQKTCLRLNFMKSITGNKTRKDLTFHGQVSHRYAPVKSWDATLESDDPNVLGPQSIVLHCENLSMNDMSPVSGSGGGNLELTAIENVIAEGTIYTARCAALKYSKAKDWLKLYGDGRSDAELFKQEGIGRQASHFAAQEITYFLGTGRVDVNGLRSLQMNQSPSGAMAPSGK